MIGPDRGGGVGPSLFASGRPIDGSTQTEIAGLFQVIPQFLASSPVGPNLLAGFLTAVSPCLLGCLLGITVWTVGVECCRSRPLRAA